MFDFLRRRAREGGVYSVVVDDRGYAVAKVLAVERGAVHVRVYSNRYRERPASIGPEERFLAPLRDVGQADLNASRPEERSDPGPFGIGHLPLRPSSFAAWRPRLMAIETVQPDELEGYEIWRVDRGGLF